jgi:two-component system, autoinducer 1 sensor kinase/phosphatase LuxN
VKSPTVLCVDDAEIILAFYQELLERNGYEVIAASNGAQALDAFHSQAQKIDVAILDYEMPGMNGLELAMLLKNDAPTLPIVMISADPPALEDIPLLVDATLTKGTSNRHIIDSLRLLLGDRSSEEEHPC